MTRISSNFVKNKQINCQQESVPLSNDFRNLNSNNKSIEKVQLISTTNDFVISTTRNDLRKEDKKEFIRPIKIEDFGDYFESSYKSGALKNEYSVS